VIADVRGRAGVAVWLVGTSRGATSAANVAARLSGPVAPDGLVLTSAVMAAGPGGQRPRVTQTVGPATTVGAPSVSACQGRTPHGFVNQEAEVVAGNARFIRGASY
jgi:hypothetical protein